MSNHHRIRSETSRMRFRIILLLAVGPNCVLSAADQTDDFHRKLLNTLNRGEHLLEADCRKLVADMDQFESRAMARTIAEGTEAETRRIMNHFEGNPIQKRKLEQSIGDYTASSKTINTAARSGNISANVSHLDAALATISRYVPKAYRILYRAMNYTTKESIPKNIKVGDYVTDKGFFSTSTHKQFVQGHEQKNKSNTILKLVVFGRNGIPTAGTGIRDYSNFNQKMLSDMEKAGKIRSLESYKKGQQYNCFMSAMTCGRKFSGSARAEIQKRLSQIQSEDMQGPRAGQAEVLFERNAIWRVNYFDWSTQSAVLVEVDNLTGMRLKNMYTGEPIEGYNVIED